MSHYINMNDWKDFAEHLRKTGIYQTPDDFKRSVLDKMLGRFDWYYHTLISKCVWNCGAVAKKGKLDNHTWGQKCLDVLHCVERCGGKVDIFMPESVRNASPCVFVGNHMSVLETMILPSIIIPFAHPCTVIKEDLLRYPAMGQILKAVNSITVTRKDPRADFKTVMTEGKKLLSEGNSVLIFPQSTRSPILDPDTLNSLGVKLASRAKVPVVPLALKTDFSGLGSVIKEFGKVDRNKTVHFRFGTPIDAASDPKKAHKEVVNFIASSLLEWGGSSYIKTTEDKQVTKDT